MYYDDDLTVEQDADLKKVTIQIKEQMDDLMEYISKAEKDKMVNKPAAMLLLFLLRISLWVDLCFVC